MARSLSIGSPLLSSIQRVGSRSSAPGSRSGMTASEILVLSAFAPRALAALTVRESVCNATVFVFTSPGTSAGLLVKTTFSITDGPEPLRHVVEYCWALDCRLSAVLSGLPMEQRRGGRLYRVSISQPITVPALRKGRALSFVGLHPDQFLE